MLRKKLSISLLALVGIAVAMVVVVASRWNSIDPQIPELEALTGFGLSDELTLVNTRDTHGGFLGQGYKFWEFAAPSEQTGRWLAKCPAKFSERPLIDSGIWPQLVNRGFREREASCVMSTSSRSHLEIVVISDGRIFRMSLDM